MATNDPLLAPIPGADNRQLNGVQVDVARAGNGRVKRVIYQPGFRWSTHMKEKVGTDLCMHAHVGFIARGRIHVQYADGCTLEFVAPQVVAIEPGHEGWVVGDEPAVLIEVDFEGDTRHGRRACIDRPSSHRPIRKSRPVEQRRAADQASSVNAWPEGLRSVDAAATAGARSARLFGGVVMGDLDETITSAVEQAADSRLNSIVAILVALAATLMALDNIKDGNITQAMAQAQTHAVDAWSYYQAKSTKQNIAEATLDQLQVIRATTGGAGLADVDKRIAAYQAQAARYEKEKADIKAQAEGYQANTTA